jgi:hypothetical protein
MTARNKPSLGFVHQLPPEYLRFYELTICKCTCCHCNGTARVIVRTILARPAGPSGRAAAARGPRDDRLISPGSVVLLTRPVPP